MPHVTLPWDPGRGPSRCLALLDCVRMLTIIGPFGGRVGPGAVRIENGILIIFSYELFVLGNMSRR